MSRTRVITILAALIGLASVYFGVNFLVNPHGAASGFGIDPWPQGNAAGYFIVKGVRDVAAGTVVLVLLARGHRASLAWVILADTMIPTGDMSAVLTHGGSAATALGVHGATAAYMLAVSALLFRDSRAGQTTHQGAVSQVAATPVKA